MQHTFGPSLERVGVDKRYTWISHEDRSCPTRCGRRVTRVGYYALPISSAHRGGHSGGGAIIPGVGGQERYANEGTVYPHASLVEMITYQNAIFPELAWEYTDLSHEDWSLVRKKIYDNPPDLAAFSVYSSTAIWAYIVAAEIKVAHPEAIIVFGNDHPNFLYKEILTGEVGRKLVDFVGLDNNGPFTLLGLLSHFDGSLELSQVPSLAYRSGGEIVAQRAGTFPLNRRVIPDYRLLQDYLADHYDKAFQQWYGPFYKKKRMVTLPVDGGCHWGKHPRRRCRHCSINGLTPKTADLNAVVSSLETVVGELEANVYFAGDSTFGFSRDQWTGEYSFLDELSAACARSPILKNERFALMYGLVQEFLQAASLCQGFVRTWNVGVEAFDSRLLRQNSKGVNGGANKVLEAFGLARSLGYRVYASGILGLPSTTLRSLATEVDQWLKLTEEFQDILTTVSVALPAVLPGSRMYADCFDTLPDFRKLHGELLPTRAMTKLFLETQTEIEIEDAEAALLDLGRGVLSISQNGGSPVKFGGYMMGGEDDEEKAERNLLSDALCRLDA